MARQKNQKQPGEKLMRQMKMNKKEVLVGFQRNARFCDTAFCGELVITTAP